MAKEKVEKGLDVALKNLKGFLKKGSAIKDPTFVSTGHYKLDLAIAHGISPKDENADLSKIDLANFGGLPLGKLVELSGAEGCGKSSLAYRVVGIAQKKGLKCLWIDAEHSFSKTLARINGANPEDLYVSDLIDSEDIDHMYSAEEIFDRICDAIDVGYKVIVLDSVANLTTKSELDNYIADGGVGMANLAQVLSKGLKKIIAHADKNDALVIFINQLREKLGVMFGCHSYNSKVLLENGKWEKIGILVNKKSKEKVLSYDIKTGKISAKKITGWHNNGSLKKDEKFLKIEFKRNFKSGRGMLMCTPNHSIFIPDKNGKVKEIPAGDLKVGDSISVAQPYIINEVQKQIAMGSLLGDGSFRKHYLNNEIEDSNVCLRFGHGKMQKEYCEYKAKAFDGIINPVKKNISNGAYYADTICLPDFIGWDSYKFNKMIPEFVADEIDEIGLAIWYLDDGHYSGHSKKWGNGKCSISATKFLNLEIMKKSFNKFGIYPKCNEKGLTFDSENTYKFHQLICKFVPNSMNYKIHSDFRDLFEELPKIGLKPRWELKEKVINKISSFVPRHKSKFDITVEGNANYFVSGALVHNSPESTPGGRALKHLCSVRVKMNKLGGADSKIEKEHEATEETESFTKVIGGKVNVWISKNRFGAPVTDAVEIPIYYTYYFPNMEEIIFDAGRALGVIRVYKGEYRWEDFSIAGKQKFINDVKERGQFDNLILTIQVKAKEEKYALPPEVISYNVVQKEQEEANAKSEESKEQISRRRPKKDT